MEEGRSKTEKLNASTASEARDEQAMVALRAQVVTPTQHKFMVCFSFFMLVLALSAFSYALVFKSTSPRNLFIKEVVQHTNVAFGSCTVSSLGVLLLMFTYNLICVHRKRLNWGHRKRIIVYITLAQLIVQLVNSVFFLAPNAYTLAVRCSWFDRFVFVSAFVRWSCWNSLFCLLAIHTHNISPWTDKAGNLRRGEVDGVPDQPLLIMDAHFWIHLPKLVLWCCFEFCIIYLGAAYPDNSYFIITKTAENGSTSTSCESVQYTCKTGTPYKVITTLWILFLVLYMLIVQAYIRQTRLRLLLAPYKDYIGVHLMVLRLRSQVLYLTVLGVAMVPVLWYTRWDRCNNYFVAWLGLLPFQVIATSVVFTNAFYLMPIRPDNQSVRQEWLQEYSWLESTMDEAVQHRGAHNLSNAAELLQEPMFCFESAIKLLLWSELVYYDYSKDDEHPLTLSESSPKASLGCFGCFRTGSGEKAGDEVVGDEKAVAPVLALGDELKIEAVGSAAKASQSEEPANGMMGDQQLDTDALLQVAMEMYDLQDFEVIHEELLETRVLIAWSSTTAVVAFRGTAGMANALSDAKAWRTAHPPERGSWYLGRRPMVHKGFLETWKVNSLDKRVISRIRDIVEAGSVVPEDFRLYFTGHSLGGALATLAAIDLQRASSFPRLHVYTYGAPRTGNHAFACEYETLVPNTWHLINDRDAVPRSGKFWILYKRPGQRTLINQVGDMRVRPAVLEVSMYTDAGGPLGDLAGFSIKQHYMASYLRSLWSVCVAQCIPSKRVPGGRQAVDRLAGSPQMQAYFATLNLDIKGLSEQREEEVILPTIKKKSRDLNCLCNFGIIDLFINLVDDLLPFSENTAATLSLSGNVDEPQEEEAPDHLAARLSAIKLQRRMSSSLGLAERGPQRTFDSPTAASLGDGPCKSIFEERPAQ